MARKGRHHYIHDGLRLRIRNWAVLPIFLLQKHRWTRESADSCASSFYKVALTSFLPIGKIGDGNVLLTPALGKTLELADFIQHSASPETANFI